MPPKNSILIIDDSNTNVVLLEAILKSKGYKTLTALCVKEAMEILKKQKPSLIFLDLLMPEISGFDFLQSVKEDPSLQKIPIVVVSALSDEVNIEESMKLGAMEFISKPIEIEGLIKIVRKYLN